MNTQRFCPVCDGPFARGEAVVRCDGCGVLSHTVCWNRQGGCPTSAEHHVRAVAIAYGITAAPPEPPVLPAPVPRAGARVATPNAAPSARPRHVPPYPTGYAPALRSEREAAKKASADASLPGLYRGPGRWLRFWFVPAAALVTAGVAFGMILLIDRLFPEEQSQVEPADETTVVSETPLPTVRPTATPEGGETPADDTQATVAAGGVFAAGQSVVVVGTGDCLNMRTTPSTDGALITCLPDGTPLAIAGGPETGGGRIWWRVSAGAETGWVAEEYLAPR